MLQRYDLKIPTPIGITLVGEVLRYQDKQYVFENDCLKDIVVRSNTDKDFLLLSYEGNEICKVWIQDMSDNKFIITRVEKRGCY